MARGPGNDRKANAGPQNDNGADLGFEAKLWAAADALRNNMDAAEYKHVVPGLIFLKYISDAFEVKHAELDAQRKQGADPEDPDEYRAVNIFWVPPEARWAYLKSMAPQPTIGQLVDDAMSAIERDNDSLKGVLPKNFARPGLDKQRLAQIINLVSDISLGSPADRSKDTLGRVYEYFLSRFASAEGKSGGQFYTPSHVVRVLVEVLAPYKGRVYDPCCGSGGMFVQSEKFIEAHTGKLGDISIYGQESNYTTWRLAKMNLAIRGIDAQIAHGDTFHNDRHPDLKADYVLANPPFNDSDWRGDLLKEDKRWEYWIGECYEEVIDVLDDLRRLADIEILRYMGHVDGNTLRCEVFSGHGFTRTIRNIALTSDQVRESQRYFQLGQVLVSLGECIFGLRPLVYFHQDASGHATKLGMFRKAFGDAACRRVVYEVVGEATRWEEDRKIFKPELDELRGLVGLEPD